MGAFLSKAVMIRPSFTSFLVLSEAVCVMEARVMLVDCRQ
jgi:hypothetical protein